MGSTLLKISRVSSAQNHMATTFHFCVSCAQEQQGRARSVLNEAHQLVDNLEKELSEFLSESPVARFNSSRVGERIDFSGAAWTLLQRSLRINEQTAGAFDCFAKSTTRGEKIGWDDRGQIWKKQEGVHLGFGAIGKGYALDGVRALLEREGFSDFALNAGGSSVILSGFSAPGEAWKWGWGWRKERDSIWGVELAHKRGIPIAIGVSGTLEQGRHVRDPRSGQMSSEFLSAVASASSATEADALSTALFVLGWKEKAKIQYPIGSTIALGLVDQHDEVLWNDIFGELWGSPCGKDTEHC